MNDLNLFIATVLEPRESLPDPQAGKVSPLKCWLAVGSCGGGVVAPWAMWKPVDFRTDPAAILMLMERLINAHDANISGVDYDFETGGGWRKTRILFSPKGSLPVMAVEHEDLKLAVCLAFARAHGYTEASQ